MLRELIDIALLEDFVEGVARAASLRIVAYDIKNRLITASTTGGDPLIRPQPAPAELPHHPLRRALPADDPPAHLAFIEYHHSLFVLAPVYLHDALVGYVGVADLPEQSASGGGQLRAHSTADVLALPITMEKTSEVSRAVVTARWSARLLSAWCRRESGIRAATEELTLIGDIANLLTGQQDLQKVLDQIVADTARVMKCRACSISLYREEDDQLVIKARHNLSREYLSTVGVVRAQSPIDEAAMSGEVVYVEDVTTDPRVRYPEAARLEGIVSALITGMIYRGKPIGVIRVYTNRPQRFRNIHRSLLRSVASQAAAAVEHAHMIEERLRQAKLERQLELARDVQSRMIQSKVPTHPRVIAGRVYEPSSHVGGDFCDFLTLQDGRLAAIVADVSGKGVPASLLMASVRGALRALAPFCSDLGEIMGRLNRHVHRETAPAEFVTLAIVAFDAQARQLGYCSAGHDPPLIVRAGTVDELKSSGLVLGIDPSERYHERYVDLHRDDLLLLYTDGVVDAMDFAGHTFGRERLAQSLLQYAALDPDTGIRNILWDIRRFAGLAEQTDDLTLVGLRVTG